MLVVKQIILYKLHFINYTMINDQSFDLAGYKNYKGQMCLTDLHYDIITVSIHGKYCRLDDSMSQNIRLPRVWADLCAGHQYIKLICNYENIIWLECLCIINYKSCYMIPYNVVDYRNLNLWILIYDVILENCISDGRPKGAKLKPCPFGARF